MEKFRIGILVSKDYSDLDKIRTVIYDLKKKFEEQLEIVQILENYQYSEIKKFALQIDIGYSEILRHDDKHTIYSHDPNPFKYGHKVANKWYYTRNSDFLKYCNGIFGFVTKSISKDDTVFKILAVSKKRKKNMKVYA